MSTRKLYERGELGARLVQARKMSGLTQVEAATRLGITTTTLGNYERGRDTPAQLIALASELYGVNPGWLLTGKGPVKYALNGLTDDERDLIDLARQAPETIPLLKKALAGHRAFVEALDQLDGVLKPKVRT